MKQEEKVKTRNLSVAEYFNVIQQEYYIAEFRKKIYYSPKDKRYYGRVMEHKREKIQDIAQRNHLDSIFTSSTKAAEIRATLFDGMGRPCFNMTAEDRNNYYAPGNEFSYHGRVWTLDAVQSDGQLVLYSVVEEKYETVNRADVIRIL